MTTITHTDGPWLVREQGDANEYVLLTPDGRWLMAIRHNGEQLVAKQRANLALAAGAPGLLKALEQIRAAYQQHFDVMPLAWQTFDDIAAQAIAQATVAQDDLLNAQPAATAIPRPGS